MNDHRVGGIFGAEPSEKMTGTAGSTSVSTILRLIDPRASGRCHRDGPGSGKRVAAIQLSGLRRHESIRTSMGDPLRGPTASTPDSTAVSGHFLPNTTNLHSPPRAHHGVCHHRPAVDHRRWLCHKYPAPHARSQASSLIKGCATPSRSWAMCRATWARVAAELATRGRLTAGGERKSTMMTSGAKREGAWVGGRTRVPGAVRQGPATWQRIGHAVQRQGVHDQPGGWVGCSYVRHTWGLVVLEEPRPVVGGT